MSQKLHPIHDHPRLCACGCGRSIDGRHAKAKYATEKCRRLMHPPRFKLEPRWWARVLLADPCAYCDAPSEILEHVDARAKGGDPHDVANVVGACARCNNTKQANPLLLFLLARPA